MEDRTPDQHDAFSVAAWLSNAAADGGLLKAMTPELSPPEMAVAQVEGWILGVPWVPTKKAKPTAKPTVKVVGASSGGKTTKAGIKLVVTTLVNVNDEVQSLNCEF